MAKMNDPIIALMKDHTIEVHPKKKYGSLIKNSDVEYIMINVGVYAPEYLIIPRSECIRDIEYMSMTYTLYIEFDSECGSSEDELQTSHIEGKDAIDLYRAIHGLYKLEAIRLSEAYMSMSIEITSEYFMADATVFIDTGKKEIDIDMLRDAPGGLIHDVSQLIKLINRQITGDESIPVIPHANHTEMVVIDHCTNRWSLKDPGYKYSKKEKNFLRGVPLPSFECYAFISFKDFNLIKKISTFDETSYPYIRIDQTPLPKGVKLNGQNIIDYDNQYIELLTVDGSAYPAYSPECILEDVNNMRYIFEHYLIKYHFMYGELGQETMLDYSYTFKGSSPQKGCCKQVFSFSIDENDIESKSDFFDLFMEELRVNYKKHKGEIKDEFDNSIDG